MYYTIYVTTNTTNGKYYIGMHKTDNLDDGYLGSGKLLRLAIEKYGESVFTKQILFIFDSPEEMYLKEKELITESVINDPLCYNISPGGWGGNRIVDKNHKSWSSEHASMMGKTSARNRKQNPDKQREHSTRASTRFKQMHLDGKFVNNGRFFGKNHTDESKDKIRKAKIGLQVGDKNPSFGTMWITDGTINK